MGTVEGKSIEEDSQMALISKSKGEPQEHKTKLDQKDKLLIKSKSKEGLQRDTLTKSESKDSLDKTRRLKTKDDDLPQTTTKNISSNSEKISDGKSNVLIV